MDFYNTYDMCCIISLCDKDTLRFSGSNLRGFGDTSSSPDRVIHSQTFCYESCTDTIEEVERSEFALVYSYVSQTGQTDFDCRITGVTENLYQLYMNKKKVQEISTASDDDRIFYAIAKYLRSCLNDMCNTRRTSLNKLYFVCIIPSSWSQESDIIELILKPLFVQAGCVFPEDHQDRILFMSELESLLSYIQFTPEKKNISKYIFNESRCVLYHMHVNGTSVQLTSTYFQFKEDYNLKVFEDRYYSPKIISMNESGNLFSITELNNARRDLKELVWKKVSAKDIKLPKMNGDRVSLEDITDEAMRELLEYADWNLQTFATDNHSRRRMPEVFLTAGIPGEIILEVVEENIGVSVLSNQLKRAFNFIVEQNTKIPFHRKSILYSGLFDGLQRFQEAICKILLYTLDMKMQNYYKEMDQNTWHNFGDNLSILCNPRYPALVATRKAMVSNFALKPMIITKHQKQNMLGVPLYYPIQKVTINCQTPRLIVYIDISEISTNVVCEGVDNNGYINRKFTIDVESLDKRLTTSSVIRNSLSTEELYNSRETEKNMNGTTKNDNALSTTSIILQVTNYLKSLIFSVNDALRIRKIQLEQVGYVLSLEKTMMKDLRVSSKDVLLDFFKKTTGISCNLTVINQGEKLVWDKLQKSLLRKPLYYVHAHMSTNYIYLKLHQVVDITDSNNGKKENASVFLKDELINIRDPYQQISELLWNHIQFLNEKQSCHERDHINNIYSFSKFSEALDRYLKEEQFCIDTTRAHGDLYDVKHMLNISEDCGVTITLQELLTIAIIPVLRQLVNTLVCSLTNEDLFGHYETARLIMTGGSLLVNTYNENFHNIITNEMEKEFKRLLRELGCKTNCTLLIDTCKQTKPDTILTNNQDQSFCHDVFLKGDLCVVSDSTYFINRLLRGFLSFDFAEKCKNYIQLDGEAIEYDGSRSIIVRGDKLVEKRIKVDAYAVIGEDEEENVFGWPEIWRYSEPCSLKDIENQDDFVALNPFEYWGYFIFPYRLNTIHVEALHYSSCIRISLESHGPQSSYYGSFSLGERQILRYF